MKKIDKELIQLIRDVDALTKLLIRRATKLGRLAKR